MEREKIIVIEQTDSTNTQLKKLAFEGAEHGTVLVARSQSGGRGRLGRSFESPEEGIYLSVLWKPDCLPEKALSLTPLAAVAVHRAVEKVTGMQAGIKWPNDLLINGKKACGILAELCMLPDGKAAVILGIGLNVNCGTEAFSAPLRETATSLYIESGKKWELELLLEMLIAELDCAYEKWESDSGCFLEEYRHNCVNIGREVLIIKGEEKLPAVVENVDEDFSLSVSYPDGTRESIFFGEVSLR